MTAQLQSSEIQPQRQTEDLAASSTKILTDLFLSPQIKEMLSKHDAGAGNEDLKSELFLVLCNQPKEKINQMSEDGQLLFFATGIVRRMIFQKNSKFHRTYRKCIYELNDNHEEQSEPYDYERDKLEEKISEVVSKNLHWVEKSVLDIYLQSGSQVRAASNIGITDRQVKNIIRTAKRKIKTVINGKIMGNYVKANIEILIDVNNDVTPESVLDLMDEINEFIFYKLQGQPIPTKTNQGAFIKEISPAKIKSIV